MTQGFNIIMIGDRINPGFKSTKVLFENEDIPGIQALAVRQAQAGAAFLDVNIGSRARTDPKYMAEIVRAIQAVVTIPLCFDSALIEVQEIALKTYDRERAGGKLPLVNSITEHRWDLMSLHRAHPFKVIVMASERFENGEVLNNSTSTDIAETAKRTARRLHKDYGMAMDDIFVDLTIYAIAADTTGLNKTTLAAISMVRQDPEFKGIHMMGGLTNISQQMPAKAADGSDLKHGLENAFLTLAVPMGFDAVLCTPWRTFAPLPEDNYILTCYRNFLALSGNDAIRAVRKFYRA